MGKYVPRNELAVGVVRIIGENDSECPTSRMVRNTRRVRGFRGKLYRTEKFS